jgi:hypothetical protein
MCKDGQRKPLTRVEQFQTLQREGWASTVAQQALQTGAVVRAHSHCGVEREAAVLTSQYLADVTPVDQAAAGKPAQHPDAHLFYDGGEGLWRWCPREPEADSFGGLGGSFSGVVKGRRRGLIRPRRSHGNAALRRFRALAYFLPFFGDTVRW